MTEQEAYILMGSKRIEKSKEQLELDREINDWFDFVQKESSNPPCPVHERKCSKQL